MTGSHASVSNEHVLIVGVNWIGDSVMSMPALQAFRERYPEVRITLLVKRRVADLWALHDVPDRVVVLEEGRMAIGRAVRALRAETFDRAYVLPHSFRSAFLPWLAKIPRRIGMPGHARDWMLTDIAVPVGRKRRTHQAFEYLDLLAPGYDEPNCPLPRLSIPEDLKAQALRRLDRLPKPCIGFLPGAARGPSKRWPASHFSALGGRLARESLCGVVVLGSSDERALCESIRASIGETAISPAGETTVAEWAALLAACDLVVTNDSGGMHVAAALGTPLVALFGMTDPARTGPLADRVRILQKSERQSRDIARDSKAARESLESITPDETFEAVRKLLSETGWTM